MMSGGVSILGASRGSFEGALSRFSGGSSLRPLFGGEGRGSFLGRGMSFSGW